MWRRPIKAIFLKSPLYQFKYPKLELFALVMIFTYLVFSDPLIDSFVMRLGNLSYLGSFIGGLLFSFGFTTPFAVGFFVVSSPPNIFLAAAIGGLGAMISDLLIFKLIKFSFQDEFEQLKKENLLNMARLFAEKTFGKKALVYMSYALAGFLIASPLPDEAGVTLLSGLTKIRARELVLISYVFNTLGILALLMI